MEYWSPLLRGWPLKPVKRMVCRHERRTRGSENLKQISKCWKPTTRLSPAHALRWPKRARHELAQTPRPRTDHLVDGVIVCVLR
jgi:hypothetical protein